MKITLLGDDTLRLEPLHGALTVEAPTVEMQYSPFHMLASGLATCIFSVLQSWAAQANLSVDDLSIEVHWHFAEDPRRIAEIIVALIWPSLPEKRYAAARRASELCTIHATLQHPPAIEISTNAHMEDEAANATASPARSSEARGAT